MTRKRSTQPVRIVTCQRCYVRTEDFRTYLEHGKMVCGVCSSILRAQQAAKKAHP
jgi:hypothetical protein